jgi:hypothetical protein
MPLSCRHTAVRTPWRDPTQPSPFGTDSRQGEGHPFTQPNGLAAGVPIRDPVIGTALSIDRRHRHEPSDPDAHTIQEW